MSSAEWITDRPPTEADGDHIGSVHVKMHPRGGSFCRIYWSYVAAGAPWQHTAYWKPPAEPAPTEPDRIAALEQQMADRIANLEERAADRQAICDELADQERADG
jgi:hypothetical protein